MTDFRALRLHKTDTSVPDIAIERLTTDDLSTGNVVIANEFSSLNYKDALAVVLLRRRWLWRGRAGSLGRLLVGSGCRVLWPLLVVVLIDEPAFANLRQHLAPARSPYAHDEDDM